jgi:glycosyltransferase involved in cell wall biosynthesis
MTEINPPKITVVLCTHNRAQSLPIALESIVTQILPQSVGWEIIVVDNNSSDETCEIVDGFRRRYPQVRYLFESKQGISHARNSAIQNARGEILAFIDDDETAATDWLKNLTSNLHNGEWAGAGGRIVPQWECPRPRWLSDKSVFTLAPLALFDIGPEGRQLDQTPFGANMAFRKDVFEAYGGFRTDLGRVGKSMLSGEDTEFGRRVLTAGRQLRYEPSAVTYHPVQESRVNRKYFQEWWFSKGRSDVREIKNRPKEMNLLGIPLRLFREFLVESLRWMVNVEPSGRFICKLKVWSCVGRVFEYYDQSHDAKQERKKNEADLSPSRDRQ